MRTFPHKIALLPLFVLTAVFSSWSQDITNVSVPLDENALFGGSSDLVTVVDPTEAAAGTVTLVAQKPFAPSVQLTGTASAIVAGFWNLDPPSTGTVARNSLLPTAKSVFGLDFLPSKTVKLHLDNTTIVSPAGIYSTLFDYYADVRPSELSRFYISGKTLYDTTTPSSLWTFPLLEAFADTAIDRSVFFRFGKQYVSWGVGYWYSPADILSLAQIDPDDPEAKREGPFAFKADIPFKQNLATVYVIGAKNFDPMGSAVAAKTDVVVGNFELSLGGYYRPDLAVSPRLMMMFSGAIGAFDVYGEGVAAWGSDRTYLRATGISPAYATYTIADRPVFQGTLGFKWAYDNRDNLYSIELRGQGYYNGTGYEDTSILKTSAAYTMLNQQDRTQAGMWYAAGSANLTGLFDDVLALGTTVIANISDSSVKVTPKITLTPNLVSSFAVSLPMTFVSWGAPDRIDLKLDLSYKAFTF